MNGSSNDRMSSVATEASVVLEWDWSNHVRTAATSRVSTEIK